MPSTHVSLNFHIIFSTKNRFPFIDKNWRDELHAYLGGILNSMGARPLKIGGVSDHVHILAGLKATHCLADVLREVKGSSSEWVHEQRRLRRFSWQEGYGAVTVSPSQVPYVKNYIARQEEHHRKRTFQEEYREFLEKSGIEYDERYLW